MRISIIAILLCSTLCISSTRAASSVNIVSHSGYVDADGDYWVVGEVQNVGSQPLELIRITATYYYANGNVVGTDYGYAEVGVLNPGCKSPFEILYMETTRVPNIAYYSLAVSSFSTTSALPEKLKILSKTSYVNPTGYLHVVGEIQNLGSNVATFVELIATFYDSTGKVVAMDYTYSDPSDILAGQKAPFDLWLFEKSRVPLINSYTLTASSMEYSIQLEESPIPPTIAYFTTLFGTRSAKVIYPSDLATPKPLGCGAAMVSDWLASMAVSTKLSSYVEGLDTDADFVNQANGKALAKSQTGIVSFGGPFVNPVVKYAESDLAPTADQAPIRFQNDITTFRFKRRDGTAISGANLPVSVINQDQDMFVIEVYRDADGRNIMLCYGFGWKGTYAAGKYFDQIIYPSLYAYDFSWVIVKWDDTDSNGFVNNPADGDTYTVIAEG